MRYYFLILLLPFCCKNEESSEKQLLVSASQAVLREAPNEHSRILETFKKGQSLTDLNEVGPSESQVAQGCDVFQSPWIKVQSAGKKSGWMLAWALEPVRGREGWLLQKRLVCYFGQTLSARRNKLIQNVENLETEAQIAQTWQEARVLRDTFLQILNQRPEPGFQIQFNWLNEALPGFIFQKIGTGERPCLFADFQFWQQKALTTKGKQDDDYFETCLAAFPIDSIESFYPAWKFQISESESASQLGAGQHLKILRLIDRNLKNSPLFAPALESMKDQILEDIFGKDQPYWQPQEKIQEELEQLLADPPHCLSAQEVEALQIRQRMFEDATGNGIKVNLRSGE